MIAPSYTYPRRWFHNVNSFQDMWDFPDNKMAKNIEFIHIYRFGYLPPLNDLNTLSS